ncbi:hypothetical protein M404DRAFT_635279 [Pisolithus tinctorius Marx 270]|uniref:Uncharacterized protein n=1 Tax=Pisolithus tinctorius Marx 270 TaxID=870435 RepID=A0A0C3P6X0_PISTI|nr:hypothetical protein M404DRAFT_635279 [Pisolithus tinctorius Marx 270]
MRLIDVDVFLARETKMQNGEVVGGDSTTPVLNDFHGTVPKYAILSHRWVDNDEVDYREMTKLAKMENRDKIRGRSGYQKVLKSCQQAKNDGFKWYWVDTCCIDKRNSSELSEAINSMFLWYESSQKCYAYLHDVAVAVFPTTPDAKMYPRSKGWPEWFSRGWTLQELIAPTDLQFFNKDWEPIGDKRNIASTLEEITRVPSQVLEDGLTSYRPSVAQVMSWAADRRTTRVEDRAYSLLGLLDVNMPMLYGEGKKAFLRLQEEVIRKSNDQTIFAWNPTEETLQTCGVLADDPSLFRGCHDIIQMESREFYSKLSDLWSDGTEGIPKLLAGPVYFYLFLLTFREWAINMQVFREWAINMQVLHAATITNLGIQVRLPLRRYPGCPRVLQVALACSREGGSRPITIDIIPWRSKYYRYIGEVGCEPLQGPYQHSQLNLAYEPTSAPSGVVIEDTVGLAALLLAACTAKTGIEMAGKNTELIGVTIFEVHHTLIKQFLSSALAISLSRACPAVAVASIFLAWDVWSGFMWTSLEVIFLWTLFNILATVPFADIRTEVAPPIREYILSSDREIVLLRGPAATSFTQGEPFIPIHILWHLRLLLVCLLMYDFLPGNGGLESTTAKHMILLSLPAIVAFAYFPLLADVLGKPPFGFALIQHPHQPKHTKYMFGTRTSGVVFALLLLQTEKVEQVMNELLPTLNSKAWRKWKTTLLDRIKCRGHFDFDPSDWDDGTCTDREKEALIRLFEDGRDAYRTFERYLAESAPEHPPVDDPHHIRHGIHHRTFLTSV